MKRFEYRVLWYHSEQWWALGGKVQIEIDKIGAEGWELISVVENGSVMIEPAPAVPEGYMSFPAMRRLYLGFFKRAIE